MTKLADKPIPSSPRTSPVGEALHTNRYSTKVGPFSDQLGASNQTEHIEHPEPIESGWPNLVRTSRARGDGLEALRSSSFNDLSFDWIRRSYGRNADGLASSNRTYESLSGDMATQEQSRLDWGSRTRLPAQARQQKFRATLIGQWHCLLTDLEVLELILASAISPRDAKSGANALMRRFRTFGRVLSADVRDLIAFDAVGEAGAAVLKLAELTVARMTRDAVALEPEYSSYSTLIPYLKARMAHLRVEQLRAMFMDGACRVIADEVLQEGSTSSVHVDPRKIATRCLECDAVGLIIAHNHPGGTWNPSEADNRYTIDLEKALSTLGIALHDHIVVSTAGCFSYRGNKLMTDQNMADALSDPTEEASAHGGVETSEPPAYCSTATEPSVAPESTRGAHHAEREDGDVLYATTRPPET